jgi:hypothetical protein
MTTRIAIGQDGVLAKPLTVYCYCKHEVPAGAKLKVLRRVSEQPGNPRIALCEYEFDGGRWVHIKLSKIWFEEEQIVNV